MSQYNNKVMSKIVKIRKDFLGLYVNADGTIARPFYGTMFNEGDTVKAHHFGGSTRAGVTTIDENFSKHMNSEYERWSITGLSPTDLKTKSKEEIEKQTNFYNDIQFRNIYKLSNKLFKKHIEEKQSKNIW